MSDMDSNAAAGPSRKRESTSELENNKRARIDDSAAPTETREASVLDEDMPDGSEAGNGDSDTEAAVLAKDPAARQERAAKQYAQAKNYLIAQTHPIIIPSYAAWFDMASLNDIERKSLPEFFNSRNRSKTPSIYKDYRDFMINTYRLNPSEYLTVTACRRNLAGDVCAIMRVHAFLEQWGLINYQVSPLHAPVLPYLTVVCIKIDIDTRPSALGPPFTGHFRVLLDSPRGLQPLHPGRKSTSAAATNGTNESSKPQTLHRNIYQSSQPAALTDPAAKELVDKLSTQQDPIYYSCDTCGSDCTGSRYHSLKQREFQICPPCYNEGRFPNTMFSGDFIKFERGEGPYQHLSSEGWSEEEKLLLLEGVEMFDSDWEKVAEHVATRSKDQCIKQFLELPIEDPYLEMVGSDLGGKVPLSQADNPVMSVVAFLGGLVDSKVAKGVADGVNGAVKSANVALGAAANKASLLASEEDKELHSLTRQVVDAQVKKLELKIAQYEKLESLLEAERRSVDTLKTQLLQERVELAEQMAKVKEVAAQQASGMNVDIPTTFGQMAQQSQGMDGQPSQITPQQGMAQGMYQQSVNGSYVQM